MQKAPLTLHTCEEVTEWVSSRVAQMGLEHKISGGFFFDNPYFCGSQSQASLLLPTTGMMTALRWLAEAIDGGATVPIAQFHPQFCAPAKLAATFISSFSKKYSQWLDGNEAWRKVQSSLSSDPLMRMEILRCMKIVDFVKSHPRHPKSMSNDTHTIYPNMVPK